MTSALIEEIAHRLQTAGDLDALRDEFLGGLLAWGRDILDARARERAARRAREVALDPSSIEAAIYRMARAASDQKLASARPLALRLWRLLTAPPEPTAPTAPR